MVFPSALAPQAWCTFAATATLALATVSGCTGPINQADSDTPGEVAVTRSDRSVHSSGEVDGSASWSASEAKSVASRTPTVSTLRGLEVVPDVRYTADMRSRVDRILSVRDTAPVLTLDETLAEIGDRCGARTRAFVALRIEVALQIVALQIEHIPTFSGAGR